jgi:thiol-disulfide isomerase/thioredoxin
MKEWIKKKWKDILFFCLIGLLLIPQVRQPVQVFLQQLLAGSPNQIAENEQQILNTFDWSLQDLDGNQFNLRQSKGNVMLINSWATWCPPCIAEMPSLQLLYADYKHKVDFYFVSNEKKSLLKQWLKHKSFDLPVYQVNGRTPEQLNSSSLPTTYVIDRKGKIIIEEVGAHDWNSSDFRAKLDRLISAEN